MRGRDRNALVSARFSAQRIGTVPAGGRCTVSDMGTFSTSVGIENMAARGRIVTLPAVLVDTGAEGTWIPRAVLLSLGITPERTELFQMADGRILEREVGFAIVHVAG